MKRKTENCDELKVVLADIVSWVFFPPLVATVFFVFLTFWYSQDLSQGLKWLVTISPFLIFFPLAVFLFAYKFGWVSDFDITKRDERPILLFVMIGALIIASAILYYLRVPMQFFVYAFSGLVLTVITAIITLYWKVSYHSAIVASVVTAINILGGLTFWPFFLLIPLVCWARVTIKKHTLWQVIGGALISIAVTTMIYYLFGFELIK